MFATLNSKFSMTAFVASILAGFVSGSPVAAGVEECVKLYKSSDRLDCYDRFIPRRAPKSAKSNYVLVEANLDSAWRLISEQSSSGSNTDYHLRVLAKQLWIPKGDEKDTAHLRDLRPSIWFQCVNSMMSGFVEWGIFLDVNEAKIVFVYDKGPVQKGIFKLSRDHTKIESAGEDQLVARIIEMFDKRTLTASIKPLGEPVITVSFDVSGLRSKVRPLRQACNW